MAIELVLGGARSGKSSYAESLAQQSQLPVTYIATAIAKDDEMKQRIALHQEQRPSSWRVIEEPRFLSTLLDQLLGEQTGRRQTLLIDCMTLWLSNWLCEYDEAEWLQERERFLALLDRLKQGSRDNPIREHQQIIIVSNEVGSGIVPMGELTRRFADHAGWLNQALARVADRAVLLVAGCPMELKGKSP